MQLVQGRIIKTKEACCMMKKMLINPLKTFAITSLAFLISSFQGSLGAWALSNQEVLQKLSSIPVFTIGNQEGEVALINSPQTQRNVAILYLNQQQAQTLVRQLQKQNPQQSYQVLPMSLAGMYEFVQEQQGQTNPPLLELVPMPKQVEAAQNILRQQGQSSNFQGVPLFYVTLTGGDQETFLTARSGNQTIIPLYLEQETARNNVQQLIRQEPDLASAIKIRVMSLEQLITILETQDNQAVRQMTIISPKGSAELLQKIQ